MAERNIPIRDDGLPNYPSNAKGNKKEASSDEKEERVVKQVATGIVRTKKKGLAQKAAETFVQDDIRSVGDYILHDVLIPAFKSLIYDTVTGGIDMTLYGGTRGSNTRRDGGRSHVDYGRISTRSSSTHTRVYQRDRARHDFNNLTFETRGEAEVVLSALVDLVVDYGSASVADLYDLTGLPGEYTDQKYGWYDLSSATVIRGRGAYELKLPRTVTLD